MIPYDKRDGKIWYNGELVEWQDAKFHVISHGLHYASLVFEGLRVYDGEIFKLEEHTERLFYSAKRLDMEIPYNQKEINEASKNALLILIAASYNSHFCNSNTLNRCHCFCNKIKCHFSITLKNNLNFGICLKNDL